jgi:hypothetical protein
MNMKKLSNYTHARYCCDIADVTTGIYEIKQTIEIRLILRKQPPYYYYIRLKKLNDKLNKLQQ